MEELFTSIYDILKIDYIFVCNLISWVIFTSIPYKFTKGWKRFIAAIVAFITALFMMCFEILDMPEDAEITGNFLMGYFVGFFIQFFSWDYLWKYVVNYVKTKFKVDDSDKKLKED